MNKQIFKLVNLIILIIILLIIYLKIFMLQSIINFSDNNNESNDYDKYEIDYGKYNSYHFYFKINKDDLDSGFTIMKSETYNKLHDSSVSSDNLEDFSIVYNGDNKIHVKVNTYNNNIKNDNIIYDYIDQDDYLTFDIETLINTNIDLEINLILENKFIYVIVNNKLVEYREMDYEFKDDYSNIYTNINILDKYKLYYDINNYMIDFKY